MCVCFWNLGMNGLKMMKLYLPPEGWGLRLVLGWGIPARIPTRYKQARNIKTFSDIELSR